MLINENLLQVRSLGVAFYVLRDEHGLYLIDSGFLDARRKLRGELKEVGWDKIPILGILLSHGHLDHILHVKNLANEHGAWVAGSAADLVHFEGRPKYSGFSKLIGWAEWWGRVCLPFQSFTPDRFLEEGQELDFWGGLEVVSLPGHTAGHIGFYSPLRKLLFCGDLFASFGGLSHLPPSIFNEDSEKNRKSISRALELDLDGVLPNHCKPDSPQKHLQAMIQVAQPFNGMNS